MAFYVISTQPLLKPKMLQSVNTHLLINNNKLMVFKERSHAEIIRNTLAKNHYINILETKEVDAYLSSNRYIKGVDNIVNIYCDIDTKKMFYEFEDCSKTKPI